MALGLAQSFFLCLPGWRAPCTLKSNRCTARLFFFLSSWGNHKPNILLEDGFWGALWANGEEKWINNWPRGRVNQQTKGGVWIDSHRPPGRSQGQDLWQSELSSNVKASWCGSLQALRKWLSRLSAAWEPLEANVMPSEGWCSSSVSSPSPRALCLVHVDPVLSAPLFSAPQQSAWKRWIIAPASENVTASRLICSGHTHSFQADENHFLPRLPGSSAQGVTGIEGSWEDNQKEGFSCQPRSFPGTPPPPQGPLTVCKLIEAWTQHSQFSYLKRLSFKWHRIRRGRWRSSQPDHVWRT